MSTEPLHLMVYDAGAGALSRVWWGGQHLYRALGRFDAALPARSWEHAFGWLASFARGNEHGRFVARRACVRFREIPETGQRPKLRTGPETAWDE